MKQKSKEKTKGHEQQKVKDELAELNRRIEELEKEKKELFEKLQRVSADYANFQKRVPKQTADTIAYEKERLIKALLPGLDSFEHMLQNACSTKEAKNTDAIVKGVEIIYKQILDILKSQGVEQIEAVDEKFDPALHQAMMQRVEAEKEDSVVLEEFQKGYKLNGRVIRPSKVVVNKLEEKQHIGQVEAEHEKEEEVRSSEQEPAENETENEG